MEEEETIALDSIQETNSLFNNKTIKGLRLLSLPP